MITKRTSSVLAVLLVALLTALATPAAAQELLEPGARGPAVARWQEQLNAVRQDDIAVDGIYGPVTTRATRDFQRSTGILVDGIVGPQTRATMAQALRQDPLAPEPGEPTPVRDIITVQEAGILSRGDRGEPVAALQRLLNSVRHADIAVDGVFGPRTEAAVQDVQRSHGILVDGVVGPQTVGVIEDVVGVRVPEPAPGPATGEASADAALSVTGVRTGAHAGFDRVVFDLAGTGEPGWQVDYVQDPRQQGSGHPVPIESDAYLRVLLRGTVAPPSAVVPYYDGPEVVTPEQTSNVQQVYMGSWFEGVYDAVIGLRSEQSFNVFTLDNPSRLVVDIATPGS